jgi:DNA-binding transcriptional regulator YdaS (Cro superfamily)
MRDLEQVRGQRARVSGPARDAAAIWAALHGFATLRSFRPQVPWPDTDTMLDRIVYGLAQIRDA